jgi:hypothetical protein
MAMEEDSRSLINVKEYKLWRKSLLQPEHRFIIEMAKQP